MRLHRQVYLPPRSGLPWLDHQGRADSRHCWLGHPSRCVRYECHPREGSRWCDLPRRKQGNCSECSALIRVWHILLQADRPASAAQPLPSDRSQTALCPDCKHTFALFSEGASGWNTRPSRQMHRVLQRTPCQTKRRIASCRCLPTLNFRDGYRIRARVIAKGLMWGQPAVTPRRRRRRHRRRGRDHRENVLPTMRPGQWGPPHNSLRGSGAEPASWITGDETDTVGECFGLSSLQT